MQKIALVTDSGSDLTLTELKEHNIHLVPFRIIYPEKEYNDVLDITSDEVYARLKEVIPSTSLPSIDLMTNLFSNLEKDGYTHVLMVSISSAFSGTSNSFRLISENFPNLTTYIYDSKTLSGSEGTLALIASDMIKNNFSFEEIIAKLTVLRTESHLYFTIDTLEYLQKGGRIGKVAGTIGSILDLKPIIYVTDEGVYETFSKIRGQKQALSKIQKITGDILNKDGEYYITIVSGGADELSKKLHSLIKDLPNIESIRFSKVGPALGVNTGPGTIGICIQRIL
ncbi:MAG: DegV family protein [Clostridium sp.]